MRRREVVAAGGEDHQRNADALEVNDTGARRAVRVELHLALLKPVADEQVLNGGEDFFTAEEKITRPPAFKFEEALAPGIDIGIQVVEIGRASCRERECQYV